MRRIVLGLIALCSLFVPMQAQASTILQFTELVFNTPITITATGASSSSITAVNVPVNVIFDPSFCLFAGCGGATNGTYLFNLSAASTSPATLVNSGNDINQEYAGSFSFTNGATNLLTVNFSDLLAGSVNGGSPTLASSQPPDIFSGTSSVFDPAKLGIPRGFSFSMSNFTSSTGGLALTAGNNSTVSSAVADMSGTISVTPNAVSPVPEPASLVLLGTGLVGMAEAARRRRRVR